MAVAGDPVEADEEGGEAVMQSLFDLPPAAKPVPQVIVRKATLSDCRQYRFTLTRTWRAGPHVCFVGVNPSTADHTKDDPTVRRWIHFSDAWGYGGFVAVNLYPFRTPNVAACKRWADWESNGPDWHARDTILHNVDIIAREAKRAALVVPCWGASAWDDFLVDHVIEHIQSGEAPWPDLYCLGKTSAGDPKHPMARGHHRIPDDQQPVLWRAANA